MGHRAAAVVTSEPNTKDLLSYCSYEVSAEVLFLQASEKVAAATRNATAPCCLVSSAT